MRRLAIQNATGAQQKKLKEENFIRGTILDLFALFCELVEQQKNRKLLSSIYKDISVIVLI